MNDGIQGLIIISLSRQGGVKRSLRGGFPKKGLFGGLSRLVCEGWVKIEDRIEDRLERRGNTFVLNGGIS